MTVNNIQMESKLAELVPRIEVERKSSAPVEIKKYSQPLEEIDIEAAVEELNDFATHQEINLSFKVDKSTGKTVIQVMDAKTEEVVRQYPPEEILDMAASLKDMAGNFFDVIA